MHGGALVLILAAGCTPFAGSRDAVTPGPTGAPTAAIRSQTHSPPWVGARGTFGGRETVAGRTRILVRLRDNYFEPTRLIGTPGQRLLLRLPNRGLDVHNLSLPQRGIDVDLAPGEIAELRIVFPRSGTLRFFCKYHLWHNMRGELKARTK